MKQWYALYASLYSDDITWYKRNKRKIISKTRVMYKNLNKRKKSTEYWFDSKTNVNTNFNF